MSYPIAPVRRADTSRSIIRRLVLSVLCTLGHEASQSVHKKPCRIRPGLREFPRMPIPRTSVNNPSSCFAFIVGSSPSATLRATKRGYAGLVHTGDAAYVGQLYFHPSFQEHCLPNPLITDTWRTIFRCVWSPAQGSRLAKPPSDVTHPMYRSRTTPPRTFSTLL